MNDSLEPVLIVCLLLAISVPALVLLLFFMTKRNARAGLIPVFIPVALLSSILTSSAGLVTVIEGFRRLVNEGSGDLESVVGFTQEAIRIATFGAYISLAILTICLAVFITLLRRKGVVPQREHPNARRNGRLLVVLSLIPAIAGCAVLLAGNWASVTPMSVMVTDPPEGFVTTYVFSAGFDENDPVDAVSARIADNLLLTSQASVVILGVLAILAIISGILGRRTELSIGFAKIELVIVLFICLFLTGYLMWLSAQLSWLHAVFGGSSTGL